MLPFYDKYLKGLKTSYDERPNVEYLVRNTGKVRSFETWPPPGTQPTHFYLAKGPTGSVTSFNDGGLGIAAPGQERREHKLHLSASFLGARRGADRADWP